jgi:hypothetical protein
MAAVDGPVRFRPTKNASIAATVDATATHSRHNQPDARESRRTPPVTTARAPKVPAAPAMTRADSTTGGSRCTTVSATRMYAVYVTA